MAQGALIDLIDLDVYLIHAVPLAATLAVPFAALLHRKSYNQLIKYYLNMLTRKESQ